MTEQRAEYIRETIIGHHLISFISANMKKEISAACHFLIRLMGNKAISATQRKQFSKTLQTLLSEKFRAHWDEESPMRGNAYRALSTFHGNIDVTIRHAAQSASIEAQLLNEKLPSEFVIWIDPKQVSYRIGDYGTVHSLYNAEAKKEKCLNVAKSRPVKITKPKNALKGSNIQSREHDDALRTENNKVVHEMMPMPIAAAN
jgi:protein Tob/BTG